MNGVNRFSTLSRAGGNGAIQPEQARLLTVIKGAALLVVTALLFVLVLRTIKELTSVITMMTMLSGLLAGYLASDLLSGFVHWFCDTFFEEDTPFIGRIVIRPFREHHREPSRITEFGMLEQDGTSSFVLIPLLLAVIRFDTSFSSNLLAILLHGVLIGLSAGMLLTNLFHKWAHAERVPSLVGLLQKYRIILSADAHQVHHRQHANAYCVTNGWFNVVADRFDWFGRLERLIRRRPAPRTAED